MIIKFCPYCDSDNFLEDKDSKDYICNNCGWTSDDDLIKEIVEEWKEVFKKLADS